MLSSESASSSESSCVVEDVSDKENSELQELKSTLRNQMPSEGDWTELVSADQLQPFQIFVNALHWKPIVITISSYDFDIRSLKAVIEAETGIPAAKQLLTFGKSQPQDQHPILNTMYTNNPPCICHYLCLVVCPLTVRQMK